MTDWTSARRTYSVGDTGPEIAVLPSRPSITDLDRIALALERIADALESREPQEEQDEPSHQYMLDGTPIE